MELTTDQQAILEQLLTMEIQKGEAVTLPQLCVRENRHYRDVIGDFLARRV